jgi:hypothetical protein
MQNIYQIDEDKQHHIKESIPFILEPMELYSMKKEGMDLRIFHEINGYDLWHQWLMHCPNKDIRESIHAWCPSSCIIATAASILQCAHPGMLPVAGDE